MFLRILLTLIILFYFKQTGVGKTSSVQYLAYQTNHKLVVVNMNNQSDVSDLIGGFKPVDIS